MNKLAGIYWGIGGVVGLFGGVFLLFTEEYLWGVVGIVAGAYLFYVSYKKFKAK